MPMSPKLPFKLHTVMFLRQPYPKNPDSGILLLVKSGILDFAIRNTAQGVRNPESKFHWQRLEFSSWNPQSKTVLDSLTWGDTKFYTLTTSCLRKRTLPDLNHKSLNLYSISIKNLWPRVFDQISSCDLFSQTDHLLLYRPQSLQSLTTCCQPRRATTTATAALLPALRAMRLSPGLFSRTLSKYPSVRYSKQLRLKWLPFQGKGEGGWGDVFGRLSISDLSLSLPAFKSAGYGKCTPRF